MYNTFFFNFTYLSVFCIWVSVHLYARHMQYWGDQRKASLQMGVNCHMGAEN